MNPSVAVAYAMAEVCGTDPTHLEPLANVIDPAALNRLCRGVGPDGDCTVIFEYLDHHVRVESYGIIEIEPLYE